jgi:magnesium-protoporphyrin O-methyltransferase
VDYRHGNFVELAADVPPADIVTLDRVICCYPDMEQMVGFSVARAAKLYGLVYPRNTWWMRAYNALQNFFLRLSRSRFRTYLHPTEAVEALVKGQGFKRSYYRKTFVWQVVLYNRTN